MGTGHYQKGKPRYSAHPFAWDFWRGLPQGDLRVGGRGWPEAGLLWATPKESPLLAQGQGSGGPSLAGVARPCLVTRRGCLGPSSLPCGT